MGSLDVGSVLAETYEVTRLIGRGGMGEVWLASHRRLPGKQVAIKVLHLNGKPLSPDALTRFRREAEVATRINHPNIVEVHDFNTLPDGAPYLVLEFLQGESLASRLRHPMEVGEVERILRQVGSALQAAHAHGAIHRDLKPDNIFIVQEPMGAVVKVLDFGISKVVDSTTLQTQEAVLVGTPAYMSPEQATGNNKDVGPQSDVFALGSIAYEMLAGVPPFSSESVAQLVFKIAYQPHPPLQTMKPGLPANVVLAVERALLKDRSARYPDIAAFIEELTGSPLPATRRPEGNDEPSGVATPGSGSNESLMMGKTAAPGTPAPATSAPVTPAVRPAAVPSQIVATPPTPFPSRRPLILVGVGVALFLAAVSVAVNLRGPQKVAISVPLPEPEPEPVPVPVVAVVDAGTAEGVVAEAALVLDAGGADGGLTGARQERALAIPGKRFPLPPADELSKLQELERLIKELKFGEAVDTADRTNRMQLSPVGLSYAAMLSTRAHCGRKDQLAAQTRYRSITESAHRTAAKSFCETYIDVSVLRY